MLPTDKKGMESSAIPVGHKMEFELRHEELIPFVRTNLRRINLVTVIYYALNILMVGWIALELKKQPSFEESMSVFSVICAGFLPTLLLVPLHEWLHGVAYRACGATSIDYTAEWRKFYFTAQADQFIADVRQFYLIAFTPIVVISAMILLVIPFVAGTLYHILLGMLFIHTAMCSGDFAIAGFMHEGRFRNMLTYDDVLNKKSYFFASSTNESGKKDTPPSVEYLGNKP